MDVKTTTFFALVYEYYLKHPGMRKGQALFNCLPEDAAKVVAGSEFDPWQRHFSQFELMNWIDHHLILDGTTVIGVMNRVEVILWTKEA